MIPADIQLLEENAIKVDESSLTGESVPVEKEASKEIKNLEAIDSNVHLFKGTLQTNGRGIGIILATGMNTQLGKIADLLQEKRPNTPLQIRMEKFGKTISLFILLICLVIFGMGILRGGRSYPSDAGQRESRCGSHSRSITCFDHHLRCLWAQPDSQKRKL